MSEKGTELFETNAAETLVSVLGECGWATDLKVVKDLAVQSAENASAGTCSGQVDKYH